MVKMFSQSCQTITAKVRVSKVDEAAVNCTGIMGGGAVIVSMLGAKTPAASLPEGALFDPVTRTVLVAPKTIREGDFVSLMLFAKYCVAFLTIFSFFDIGWTLGSEDAWNLMIMGGDEESGGGRGMCGKEMLLEAC